MGFGARGEVRVGYFGFLEAKEGGVGVVGEVACEWVGFVVVIVVVAVVTGNFFQGRL